MDNGALLRMLNRVDQSLLEQGGRRLVVRPERCVLVAHVHILRSTIPFFERLVQLGFDRDAIFIIPKAYSTVDWVRDAIFANGIRNILDDRNFRFDIGRYDQGNAARIEATCAEAGRVAVERKAQRVVLVDDGGLLSKHWYKLHSQTLAIPAVSVQQTASGIKRSNDEAPIIKVDVARSAAKRCFEAHIIVAGVLDRIRHLPDLPSMRRVGVLGVGAIGARLAQTLVNQNKRVFTLDVDETRSVPKATACKSVEEFLGQSDFVFGCTGRNALRFNPLLVGGRMIHAVSCSSRDIEFKYVLDHCSDAVRRRVHEKPSEAFSRITVHLKNGPTFAIENGGFPINFDRQHEWEDETQISLTRALVLLGILQSLTFGTSQIVDHSPWYQLNAFAQRELVRCWLTEQKTNAMKFGVRQDEFDDLDWWAAASDPTRNLFHKMPVIAENDNLEDHERNDRRS